MARSARLPLREKVCMEGIMERPRKQVIASLVDEVRSVPKGVLLSVLYYVAIIVVCSVQSALMDRDTFVYDLSMLRGILCMVVSVCAVWLLVIRAHSARLFCIAGTSAVIALSVIDDAFCGAYAGIAAVTGDMPAWLLLGLEYLMGLVVVYYCATAPELKAFLYDAIDLKAVDSDTVPSHKLPLRQRIGTWPFWRDATIYFIVFSMLGHWAEMLFCRLIIAGVFMGDYDPTNAMLWDQWLFPFSAEGIALVMVALVLHPLKEHLLKRFNGNVVLTFIVSFAINMAVCTSIDFLTGMAVNQDYSLWDYRALPFNFMGQVCLQNSLVYSIAATIIVWWVYPAMDALLTRLPHRVSDGVFFAHFGMYLFLAMLHFVVV